MHKKWLFSGLVVIFLAANLFYWLPVMADPSVCSEGFKCFFNDEGSLFFKSSSSTSDFLYLNYIGSNAYGLAVSATGELYHDGVSVVVADGGTYGLNISGSSNAIAIKSAQVAPGGAINNSQSSFNSQDQRYLDSTVDLPVYGFYSNYHNYENRVSSQLALVIEGDATGGNQYLQFRFNDPADPNNWGIWHEVCDLSNNCRNLVNYDLDDRASSSLVMYGDPDGLFDSGLKIGSSDLSNCGSLSTTGGVIGCGVAGGSGGVAGSGTINYLPKWSNTSTLANSLIYDNGTNVGISNTSPVAKLDVTGGINASLDINTATYLKSTSLVSCAGTLTSNAAGQITCGPVVHASTTLTAIGTAPNANGATLTGQALNLQPASASYGGVITTGAQTFAGAKTFNGGIVGSLTGNASTATALAANGSNCAAGSYPLGIDASGNVESCTVAGGSGGVAGSGTINYLPKWSNTSTLANSLIYDNGTNVGISNTSPVAKLDVTGGINASLDINTATYLKSTSLVSCAGTLTSNAAGQITCGPVVHASTTLTAIGTAPNANGATLTGQALTLQPASASYGGIVTTGTQTFAGTKTFSSTIQGNISGTADQLAANGDNCSAGYYPLGVDEKGKAEDCTLITGGGTYTADGNGLELVGNSFRLELNGTTLSTSSAGLRVNAIGSTEISDGSIVNADISGLAAISASKIENGTYFINSAGTNGYVWTSDGSGAGTWSAASTIPANNITGSTAGTLNYIPKYTANYTLANSLIYDNGTNVGIGTSSPGTKLTVAGAVSFDNNKILSNGSGDFFASKFYDQNNTSYYLDPAAATSINAAGIIQTKNNFFTQNGQYLAQNSSTTNPTFSWISDTNTGLFRKAAETVAFTTNGSEKFSLDGSGKAIFTNGSVNLMTIEYSAGLSGALVTIGDGGTSKLDVGTVDPIYTIGGQKYATYMAGMTGVKEETSGVLILNKQSAGLFMAKLDFQKAPEGSDIWLFGRTANLINSQDNFDQLACLLTPNFAGQAWYEKDWDGRSINIFARPDNVNRASVEVSYRLTAPRFDSKQWTNYSDSQHSGFNLDELLK